MGGHSVRHSFFFFLSCNCPPLLQQPATTENLPPILAAFHCLSGSDDQSDGSQGPLLFPWTVLNVNELACIIVCTRLDGIEPTSFPKLQKYTDLAARFPP